MLGGRTLSIRGDFERQAGNVLQRLQRDPERDIYHTDNWPQPSEGLSGRRRLLRCAGDPFPPPGIGLDLLVPPRGSAPHPLGRQAGKLLDHWPSGPRLTPRGSFEAWEEVVRGHPRPGAKPTWRSPKSCAWT